MRRAIAYLGLVVLAFSLFIGERSARAEGGPFGLGLILGSPTGLSGKVYLSRKNAIDFAVGDFPVYHRGLGVHVDYLWHPVMLADDQAFFLPLYFGIGARVFDHHTDRYDDHLHVGARAPLGILFDFKRVPIDIFIELALVLDFFVEDRDRFDEHDVFLDVNGAVGIRYYF
jgi:hypothetical protein